MFRCIYQFSRLPGLRKIGTSLEQIEATVFEVLKQHEKVNPSIINRTSSFQEIGLDSLDIIEVIVEMEEKFNIDLSENEVLKIQGVMDAVNIFHKHKK